MANARGDARGLVVMKCQKQTPSLGGGPRVSCTPLSVGVTSACHCPSCFCLSTPSRQRKMGWLAGLEPNFMEFLTKQTSTSWWEEPNL